MKSSLRWSTTTNIASPNRMPWPPSRVFPSSGVLSSTPPTILWLYDPDVPGHCSRTPNPARLSMWKAKVFKSSCMFNGPPEDICDCISHCLSMHRVWNIDSVQTRELLPSVKEGVMDFRWRRHAGPFELTRFGPNLGYISFVNMKAKGHYDACNFRDWVE